jgi:hypothetical protein
MTAPSPEQPEISSSVSNKDGYFLVEKPVDYPNHDADIILRSNDSHDFHVPKLLIIKNSPVLDKLIQATSDPPTSSISTDSGAPLPVVHISETGAILHSLLTFILPVSPELPETAEKSLNLLSVAQKYEMGHILARIRGSIALRNPPLICKSNALLIFSLALKYGLRQEVVQAARLTLKSTLTIENLEIEGKLDIMPGDHLRELWEYHRRVQDFLVSSIPSFRGSGAYRELNGLTCFALAPSGIPKWIDDYIRFMAWTPSSFDLFEFQSALTRHIITFENYQCSSCKSLPGQTIEKVWAALTAFVHLSMEQVSKASLDSVK